MLVKLKKKLAANGFFYTLILVFLVVKLKAKSLFWGCVLGVPDITINGRVRVYGKSFIKFGKKMTINGDVWIEAVSDYGGVGYSPCIEFGDNVAFSEMVHISAVNKISIGSGVLFGSKVYVGDHDHGSYRGLRQSPPDQMPADRELVSPGEVVIKNNVWLGDNVVVCGGVTIGEGAVIGANSVVTCNIPDNCIAVGVPAVIIKKFCFDRYEWVKYDC